MSFSNQFKNCGFLGFQILTKSEKVSINLARSELVQRKKDENQNLNSKDKGNPVLRLEYVLRGSTGTSILEVRNYTPNEWRRCENYTRNEWGTCENYTRSEWGRCQTYTRNEWGRCEKYTRNEWGRCELKIQDSHWFDP